MLITFKSKSAADVVMYKEHAKRLLDLLGKQTDRGVITAAETGAAIATLDAVISEARLHSAADDITQDVHAHHGVTGDDHEHEPAQAVSFSTRAYPLLEMLRAAQKENQVVAWGI